ncbi:putative membrane protein [Frondihabitans australicus]|uniref:Putative membrane protein n=2 Tax=Frondihabitans australicus TaxID=386892 RepID=A0A495IKQ2_9MICO|nr:putative membrane protein [Frondihabitans australicus]
MADLIILSYQDEAKAEAAFEAVQSLERDLIIELAGLALVHVDDKGKTRVEMPDQGNRVGLAAASGAVFGALIGLFFFVPLVGLVVGGAIGALVARLDKTGVNAAFRDRVKSELARGRSAVVIYATKLTQDKFADALAPFGGTVVQTSLSDDEERELAHDLTPVA